MTATANSRHTSHATKVNGSARLTDTQLVILTAAAGRDDRHLLPVPETIRARGNALTRSLQALIDRGLAKEVRVGRDQPEWRSADDGRRIGLKITKAGMAAIGAGQGARDSNSDRTGEEHNPTEHSNPAVRPTRSAKRSNGPAKAPRINDTANGIASATANGTVRCTANATASPRPGTKAATAIDLLKRSDGASIDDLMVASGWQAHSVRGFLSGTVKKKMGLRLIAVVAPGGARRYRIAT